MNVTLAHGSPQEAFVRDVLLEYLRVYDVEPWIVTRTVVVDQDAIPHSHPVLTLGVRVAPRERIGVLSGFVHEQMHWLLVGREDASFAAIEDLRTLYPVVPVGRPDGAHDEHSTYLHLVVNTLELNAMRVIVGQQEALRVIEALSSVLYRWIYRTVLDDETQIRAVLERHELLPA